jgi:NADH-quinone oxidoreductase subunit F
VKSLKLTSVEELEDLRSEIVANLDEDMSRITVCGGTGCHASGCVSVAEAFKDGLTSRGLEDRIDLNVTGCHGFCERGPIVLIHPQGIFYQKVTPEDVEEIFTETIENAKPVERLLYSDPVTGEQKIHDTDIPFYAKQKRLVLGNNTSIAHLQRS